eukprot:TRINITY_DN12583_c0_g1_i1.p1 TRINITY_DN12583_c0_g1~~TRINITY_DN12583_c0_g1_i1.p1  ORF type:complete len:189 (+),score=64.52 TRINITY_DN12583_c0_g1_i1:132-698(+)
MEGIRHADAELNYLTEMKDIDLGDTLAGGDLLPLDGSQTIRRRGGSEQKAEEAPEHVVSAERYYREELESRFIDLRKLYYHTKEQKQLALQRVAELEASLGEKEAVVKSLSAQLRESSRSSVGSTGGRRSALAGLSTNSAAGGSPPVKERRNSTTSTNHALVQENAALKEKLAALQAWMASAPSFAAQ